MPCTTLHQRATWLRLRRRGRKRRDDGFRKMVAPQPGVGPRRSPAQALVLNNGRVREHALLRAVVFEPLVRAQPDAVAVAVDFAPSVARAAARTVALVFRALRFRTQIGDLGQRTIAAVFAAKQRGFA